MSRSKTLIETAADILEADNNPIGHVLVTRDGETFEVLQQGKWIKGRFDRNIRIDQPTHLQGQGQEHGHVYGRNNKNQLLVVNLDGSGSHGTKGRLHQKDADALRAAGFEIRDDNMVEWCLVTDAPAMLLE